MSGIWGFTTQSTEQNRQRAHALEYWTRSYGREGNASEEIVNTGLGCHVEHMSETIPCGKPLLQSGSYHAVIDVILYNREEVAAQLQLNDIDRYSDEELLFELFLAKGSQALAQVNGDFAGAIYNEETCSWTLFRDHLGIRPLYYYMDERQFAFATDLRGLTALPNADIRLNEERFYQTMAGYSALTLCRTEYDKIYCVHPGASMTVRRNEDCFTAETDIYWKPGQKKIRLSSEEAYQKELRRLITDSVQRRLNAVTGMIGAELSGGLDSSVIGILISRLHREARYFSWSYDIKEHAIANDKDERLVIEDICAQEGISCHYTPVPKEDALNWIQTAVEHMWPEYINTTSISEGSEWLRSQGARVVFTGHGGDEGVSHRGNLYEMWYHHEYYPFFRLIYQKTAGQKLRLARTIVRSARQIFKVNKHFGGTFYKPINSESLLTRKFSAEAGEKAPKRTVYFAYDPAKYTMDGGSRPRLDNVALQGAEQGVRYMIPFLDYRVYDYAVSIPRWLYQNKNGKRWIYRKAFEDIMPQSLRAVNYKDTPSLYNFQHSTGVYNNVVARTRDWLLDYLDWEFWDRYLDREVIEKIHSEENNERNNTFVAIQMNDLMKCAMIQNVMRGTRRCCEEDEE